MDRKNLNAMLLLLCLVGHQVHSQSIWIPQMVNSVSGDSLFATMADMQPMNRVNSANSMVPANYLKQRMQNYGVDTVFFQYFKANTPPNVVAIRYGTLYPNEFWVMGAHYDAVRPGAGSDDNASGTAAVIEMARVTQSYELDRSLLLVLFSAEEVGLWGSKAFVDSAVNHFNMSGMINLDMIAYSHNNLDSSVSLCYRYFSISLLNTCINVSTLYVPELQITTDSASAVLYASDHAPFWQKMIPALLMIENSNFWGGSFNPYYHTFADTIGRGANSPWLAEKISRSAIATLLWFLNPTSNAGPLPVSLVKWSGQYNENHQVNLTWSTSTEMNNNRFVVQRQDANHRFITIGTIPGAGSTTVMQHYAFTDTEPLHPVSRYRLVQIDHDGSETLFPVIEIATKPKEMLVINKAQYLYGQFVVEVEQPYEKPLFAEVFTISGSPVSTSWQTQTGKVITLRINAPASPGVYLVRVSDGSVSVVKRMVVMGER